MIFDLSKVLAAIDSNYIPSNDVLHHYVWTVTLREYQSLLQTLGDVFKLVSFNLKPPVASPDETFDLTIVHQKYIVLQVGFSQALYSKNLN